MTRAEENAKRKKAYDDFLELFGSMDEKKAKEHITKNIYKVKISKELIAAYVKTYHADDTDWLKDAVIAKDEYKNVAVVIDGKVQYTGKTHKKTGRPLYKTERVYTGEKAEKKFDVPTARKLFVKKYEITPKPTSFSKMEKGEKLFDAMEDLLG